MRITHFAKQNRPKAISAQDVTIQQFVHWVGERAREPYRGDGYALATFKNDYRKEENVEAVYALTLDFDKAEKTQKEIAELFSHVLGAAFQTKRSTIEAQRTRVVLVLSRPVNVEEYDVLWEHYAAELAASGLTADDHARDACRFWFWNSKLPHDPPIFTFDEGKPLDVDAMLEQARDGKAAREKTGAHAKIGTRVRHRQYCDGTVVLIGLTTMMQVKFDRAIPDSEIDAADLMVDEHTIRVRASSVIVLEVAAAPEPTAAKTDNTDAVYVKAALEGACSDLRNTPKGERNATLAKKAYAIGGLIGPHLTRSDARRALRDAIAGWDKNYMKEHEGTLDRQLDEGAGKPRSIPEKKSGKKKTSTKNAPPPAPESSGTAHDERPEIKLTTELHTNTDESVALLRSDPGLFVRNGELVHVTRDETDTKTASVGGLRVRPVGLANLTERLSRLGRFVRWDGRVKNDDGSKGAYVPSMPSKMLTAAVAARGEWPGVPVLNGISETPFLRPDGSICDRAGYDAATGIYLEPNVEIEPVPEFVTQTMAREALATLTEPFRDFPWETPAALSVALSAVLTSFARHAIAGPVPANAIDKNTPGTGGTLTVDVVSIIHTGRDAPRLSWPPDDIELEKLLGSLAREAAVNVFFDNIDRPFRGAPLDKALTCTDRTKFRVLGLSEAPEVVWRGQIFAIGNNMSVEGDTTRRVLLARMVSKTERPEDRSDFHIKDLRAWVRSNRARLVRAALVVLRSYIDANKPQLDLRTWGSFEAWAALVPPAIVWAGGADPMRCRILDATRSDPERAAFVVLLNQLPMLIGKLDKKLVDNDGISIRNLVGALYSPERMRGEAAPDGWNAIRSAVETLSGTAAGKVPDTKKLGYVFRRFKDRIISGRRLTSSPDRDGIQVWRSEAAGDAGDAGDVSTPAQQECSGELENILMRGGRNYPPHAPHPPHANGRVAC